jgi:hypothetical protein
MSGPKVTTVLAGDPEEDFREEVDVEIEGNHLSLSLWKVVEGSIFTAPTVGLTPPAARRLARVLSDKADELDGSMRVDDPHRPTTRAERAAFRAFLRREPEDNLPDGDGTVFGKPIK